MAKHKREELDHYLKLAEAHRVIVYTKSEAEAASLRFALYARIKARRQQGKYTINVSKTSVTLTAHTSTIDLISLE